MENVQDTINEEVKEEVQEVKEEIKEEVSGPAKPEEPKVDEKFERKKKFARDRISELTHKAHRLEEELKIERERNKGIKTDRPIPPIQNDYTDEYGVVDKEAYRKAVRNYEDSSDNWKDFNRKQAESDTEAKVELESKQTIYIEQAAELSEKYPDFTEATSKNIYSDALAEAIYDIAEANPDDTIAAEIGYYLGKNESEAMRFNRMSPRMMLLELGELKNKVQSLNKISSKAPEPLKTLDGDKGLIIKDESKMSDQEWWEQEQRRNLEKLKKMR
jgi:hypothetical protein